MEMNNLNLDLEELKIKVGTLRINRDIMLGYTGTFALTTIITTAHLIEKPSIINLGITSLNLLITSANGYILKQKQQELNQAKQEISEIIKINTQKQLLKKYNNSSKKTRI